MQDLKVFLKEIGKRVMDRRKELGLTQEALGEKSELTTQFISYLESGRRSMRCENVVKIAKALSVSSDYILTGEIIDKDKLRLSEKLDKLTPAQVLLVENIIDECIALYHKEE